MRMSLLNQFVLAAFVLALWSCNLLETGATESQYEKINAYLESHVEGDSIKDNIDGARKMLAEVSGKGDSVLIEALNQFIELEQTNVEEKMCTSEAYQILEKNNNAVGGRASELLNLYKGSNLNKVETVIREFIISHAKYCMQIYADSYLTLTETGDDTELLAQSRMIAFTQNIISKAMTAAGWIYPDFEAMAKSSYPHMVFWFIANKLDIPTEDNTLRWAVFDAAVETNTQFFKPIYNETKKKHKVDQEKLMQIYMDYAVKPCRSYLAKVDEGKEMFSRARFDATVLDKDFAEDMMLQYEFYAGAARMKVCEILTGKMSEYGDLLVRQCGAKRSSSNELLNNLEALCGGYASDNSVQSSSDGSVSS